MNKAFIIIGYTDTLKKENILKELILKLKENNLPIILVMSNIPSKDIIDLSDYFIFDKENPLMENYKDTSSYSWVWFSDLRLKSLYDTSLWYNQGLCVYKQMLLGLQTAKNLGFNKVQLFNYDTQILNNVEINNTFDLLDNYSVIAYPLKDYKNRFFVLPQYLSFNLNDFSYEELDFNLNKKKIKEEFKVYKNNGMVELVISNILVQPKRYLLKDLEDIKDQINIDLINPSTERNIFNVIPFEYNNTIHIFLQNYQPLKGDNVDFKIVYNDNIYSHTLSKSHWVWFDTFISLNDIKDIKVFVNENFILEYDFINKIDKEHFKNHSIFNHQNDIIDED